MSKRKNLSGVRNNRLVAVSPAGKKGSYLLWCCMCDCGNSVTVATGEFPRHQSCGCLKREVGENAPAFKHGLYRTKAYKAWSNMLTRCQNKNSGRFTSYGERGITVCERWKDFRNFFEDMGHCLNGLSLERINVNGNYQKDNCCWMPISMQARNKRDSIFVKVNNKSMHLCDAADLFGVKASNARWRIRNGWNHFEAISTKP